MAGNDDTGAGLGSGRDRLEGEDSVENLELEGVEVLRVVGQKTCAAPDIKCNLHRLIRCICPNVGIAVLSVLNSSDGLAYIQTQERTGG
jgi:hypothetical protein